MYVDHRSKWKPVNGWANAINSVIHSTRAAFQAKVAARPVVSRGNYTYTPPQPWSVLPPHQPSLQPPPQPPSGPGPASTPSRSCTVTQAAPPAPVTNSNFDRPPQAQAPLQLPSGPGPNSLPRSSTVTQAVPPHRTIIESTSSCNLDRPQVNPNAALTPASETSSSPTSSNLEYAPQVLSYAVLTPAQHSSVCMPGRDLERMSQTSSAVSTCVPSGSGGQGILSEAYAVLNRYDC